MFALSPEVLVVACAVIGAFGVAVYLTLLALDYQRRDGLKRYKVLCELQLVTRSRQLEDYEEGAMEVSRILKEVHELDEYSIARSIRTIMADADEARKEKRRKQVEKEMRFQKRQIADTAAQQLAEAEADENADQAS